MAYGLRRKCETCEAEKGEPCRNQRKGLAGSPMKTFHTPRRRPADRLGADDRRSYGFRSNDEGTCLLCGVTTKRRWFCTGACAQRFARAMVRNGQRLVAREDAAGSVLAGWRCIWCLRLEAECSCESGPEMLAQSQEKTQGQA